MTVQSWGTGRKDYSKNVEYATEAIIRSYQQQYVVVETGTLAAGASTTINTAITTETVVMLYDFNFSADSNVLISMVVYAISVAGASTYVFQDKNYQNISHCILKGFPFFGTVRSALTNDGDASINYHYTMAGLVTGEKEYYLRVASVLPS